MTALEQVSAAYEAAKKELFDAQNVEQSGIVRFNRAYMMLLEEKCNCWARALNILQSHRGEIIEQVSYR